MTKSRATKSSQYEPSAIDRDAPVALDSRSLTRDFLESVKT